MLDQDALLNSLNAIGLASWSTVLAPLLTDRVADNAHGHIAEWCDVLNQLPSCPRPSLADDFGVVKILDTSISTTEKSRVGELLLRLTPWRKGPFNVFGIDVDAEWRSDWKWNRLRDKIEPLASRRVLDVGCGNGYYALRMHLSGAECVIGIDPTLLFVFQFLAINKLAQLESVHVLPLRLHELPANSRAFDSTFSMGVLYHQRNPRNHLHALKKTLRPGGQLILESLVWPGEDSEVFVPESRYARMCNVWHLPTTVKLQDWLIDVGFRNIQLLDVSTTTIDEQRTTDWMPFQSLAESLDPGNPTVTVEGHPAPIRAILTAFAP